MIPRLYLTKYRKLDGQQFACAWIQWLGRPWCVKRLAVGS